MIISFVMSITFSIMGGLYYDVPSMTFPYFSVQGNHNKQIYRSYPMKIKYLYLPLLMLASISTSAEAKGEAFLFGNEQDMQITINNRILAKVNGKAISVMDLIKKMDMQFYRQFPEYTSSTQARFQFYQANWKHVLEEFIDKELILADAQEAKIPISGGDVRQEMESLFGPSIVTNLDKVGLTFEEASKMVLADLTIRRMLYFRVQSKAINQVTPQHIRNYYENYAKDNIRDNEWVFNVISIRHRDAKKAEEMARQSHHLLSVEKVPLSELTNKIKEFSTPTRRPPTITVSEEFHTKEKELSDVFKTALLTLQPDSYSQPSSQKSRSDNTTVFRIFYLKNMVPGGTIPFKELEAKIKDRLIEQAMAKESEAYLTKLRQHFDVQEAQLKEILSSDSPPFMLR